ncbi:MAG: YciI family protein [Gemmatimonadaceae bacterium]
MKFIILVKATRDSEAGKIPPESLLAEMGGFHEEMAKAGILVDGNGLKPTATAWRIKYGKDRKRTVVDGPFTETKELVAGYTIINVKSREEALAWTKRFPNPSLDAGEAEIEVRQYFELEDFGKSAAVERMKDTWKKD